MTEVARPRRFSTFLTARWSRLALLSYSVPPETLDDLTPPGCELDLLDGKAFVSLVAFDFLETNVFGVSWPGFRNFPEVNLRFYVRYNGERGVCFIREFVPRRFVAWVARVFYNEPYDGAPMVSEMTETDESITIEHRLEIAGGRQSLKVNGRKPAVCPADDSVEAFFKEHHWGYGKSRRGRLVRYRVEHPIWEVYPVQSFNLEWDWPAVYGKRWAILQDRQPDSVVLAVGSEVRVMRKD